MSDVFLALCLSISGFSIAVGCFVFLIKHP